LTILLVPFVSIDRCTVATAHNAHNHARKGGLFIRTENSKREEKSAPELWPQKVKNGHPAATPADDQTRKFWTSRKV